MSKPVSNGPEAISNAAAITLFESKTDESIEIVDNSFIIPTVP